MPNPTVIDTIVSADTNTEVDVEALEKELSHTGTRDLGNSVDTTSIKKTVVFTAFLSEQVISKNKERIKDEDQEAFKNAISSIWYPTIFFFDLDKCENVWEIFGADQFIEIDSDNAVLVRTSEIAAHSKDVNHTISSFKEI